MGEIAAYLKKSGESLASAKDDLAKKRYNSCANRSYYACYQAAVATLLKHGIVTKSGSEIWKHEFVQSRFSALIKRRKLYPSKLKSTLSELIEIRIIADYAVRMVSEPMAKNSLQKAEEFVKIISREERQ